jgi:hypothetical protein
MADMKLRHPAARAMAVALALAVLMARLQSAGEMEESSTLSTMNRTVFALRSL